MAISVIGLDYKTAGVDVRERLALNGAQVLQLLGIIASERIFYEAMILSTCNRTEFYFTSNARQNHPLEHLLAHVAQIKGDAPITDTSVFYRYDGPAAVQHLLRVAGALESQVVGEHEILGQVKDAYHLACQARTAKFLIHKLAHRAFRAGKRVMGETSLGQGTASISQAAVDLANRVFPQLADKTAMLVGAGQTAELAAQALVRAGVRKLIIANRTLCNAETLAANFTQSIESAAGRRHGMCPALAQILSMCSAESAQLASIFRHDSTVLQTRAISLAEIPAAIEGVDLVICSTGAAEPVLTSESLAGTLANRRTPILLIDLAVPRDVDPRLAELPGVVLHNIDNLQAVIDGGIQRRAKDIPAAESIVEAEAEKFDRWLASLGVVPTIKLLEQRFAAIQQAEIERTSRKFGDADRAAITEFARSLCNKIMHDPVRFLHQLDATADADGHLHAVSMLRQIFQLEPREDAE